MTERSEGMDVGLEPVVGPQPSGYVAWYGKERKQNWRTPRVIFDALHAEFSFTLDGASEPGNGLLPLASTAETPIDWAGHRVFCNPPWSNIPPFVEQAARADLAVLLVPARTNARWFHRALDLGAKPRFFVGRPKFEMPGRIGPGHNSPVDCCLLVLRSNLRLTVPYNIYPYSFASTDDDKRNLYIYRYSFFDDTLLKSQSVGFRQWKLP